MKIIRSQSSRGYLPAENSDLPMFRHLCEGMIEVQDIAFFEPVFAAHGITIQITDEAP